MTMGAEERKQQQAGSFGAAAQVYERGRPSYPAEAVDWLVPETARNVLDLGAGTGKLTRMLTAPGRSVLAVEPSEGMREQFATVLPEIPVLAGSGESIPVPDGSVDVVVCAQAWHWVDPALAVPEVARVLRPGGRLALVWNSRDVSVPWVAELQGILREYAAATSEDQQTEDLGELFGPVRRREFRWVAPMTAEEAIDMVASRSYVITMAEPARAELLGRVRELVDRHQPTGMPYLTECYRAELRPAG